MISRGVGVIALVLLIALSASAAVASQTDWQLSMMAYVGSIGGIPSDIGPKMGVTTGATDGWDSGIDLSKPPPPPPGDLLWAWFNRPTWGKGDMQMDYRSEIAENTSKVWGTGASDDFRIKLDLTQSGSGVDPCGFGDNYPVASAVYFTWAFGISGKEPPADYTFTLQYKGGINAKPAGTAPVGVTVPTINQTWDMKTVANIVLPIWDIDFAPWDPGCTFQVLPDTPKFKIIVTNPPAANQPPVCGFTFLPASPTTADTVQFTSTSSDPDGSIVTYAWTFGDGGTSASQNPTHQYASANTYTVGLTVTDNGGASTSCSQEVTVTAAANEPPTCGFMWAPTSPTTTDTVQFTDTSMDPDGTVVSWAWDFGDGGTSIQQNPTHQYTAANTYGLSLTVTDDDGASTQCGNSVTVTEGGAGDDTNWNCNLLAYWGALLGFPNDTGGYIGVKPGATDLYDVIDSKKPAEPMGEYVYAWFERPTWGQGRIMADWRAEIADGASKVWGTGISDTWNVKTNKDNGPSGYFDATCDPLQELEYPVAASIYLTWAFGVAENPPFPVPPADYTFTIQYRGGINAKPTGTGGSAPSPPAMNATWDMEVTTSIVIPLWKESFQPWKSDCSGLDAADTAKFKFIVNNPAAPVCPVPTCGFTFSPTVPNPQATVQFTDTSTQTPPNVIATWSWDFGDGNTSTQQNPTHQYAAGGDYTVSLTVTNDCQPPQQATCQQGIHVNVAPTCAITADPAQPTTMDTVQFQSGAADSDGTIASYAWNFDDGNTSTVAAPTHQFTNNGSYTVTLTVTDNQGATGNCSLPLTVSNVLPNCNITFTPLAPVVGQVISFNSNATDPDGTVASVNWAFGDGGTASGVTTTHQYGAAATYDVTATVVDDDGGQKVCSTQVEVTIAPDSTPPLVAISSPAPKEVAQGIKAAGWLAATASDPESGVTKVEFYVDGRKIGEDTSAPFEAPAINTAEYGNGAHYLGAKATNGWGLTAQASCGVDFINDTVGLPVIRQTVLKTGLLGPPWEIEVNLTVRNDGAPADNVTIQSFVFVGSYLLGGDLMLENIVAQPTDGLGNWPRNLGTLATGAQATIPLRSAPLPAYVTNVRRWMDYGTYTLSGTVTPVYTF